MNSTEPIDLELDATGDVRIDTDLHFTSGLPGIAQAARIKMQMFRGEWFVNRSEGVAYFERAPYVTAAQALLGGKWDQGKALTEFRKALLSVPGVNSIKSLTVTLDSKARVARVTWILQTVFGDTNPDTLIQSIGGA